MAWIPLDIPHHILQLGGSMPKCLGMKLSRKQFTQIALGFLAHQELQWRLEVVREFHTSEEYKKLLKKEESIKPKG